MSSAKTDLKRQAVRRFTIIDTFEEVLETKCHDGDRESNLMYPIAGAIGMHEIISTAVRINNLANLEEGEVDGPKTVGLSAPAFSDELTFTTVLDTGVLKPNLTLDAVPGILRLTTASATHQSNRTDQHKVTIAIALPSPEISDSKGRKRLARKLAAIQQIGVHSRVPTKAQIFSQEDPTIRVLWELERRAQFNQDDRLIEALSRTR